MKFDVSKRASVEVIEPPAPPSSPPPSSGFLKVSPKAPVHRASLLELSKENFKPKRQTSKLKMLAPGELTSGREFKFGEPDTEQNIEYSQKTTGTRTKVIKSATLDKLIEKTTEKQADPDLLHEFLLTYRSFCTPLELIDGLAQRLEHSRDDNVIPLRVFNVFKTWAENYLYDFSKEPEIALATRALLTKLEQDKSFKYQGAASKVQKRVTKRLETGVKAKKDLTKSQFTKQMPKPMLPQNISGTLSFMDIPAQEVARQITLIEHKMFCSIQPWECLKTAWSKDQREQLAPNITKMIHRFNQVSGWVASEICGTVNLRDRVKVLRRFIDIAMRLKALNNFNAVLEVVSGLNNSAIHRLSQTFHALPHSQQKILDELKQLVARSQNYHTLRAVVHGCSPPLVPYLGIYLTDLTFIEDGHKKKTSDGLVNFLQRRQQADVIREIQQYQQSPYCLETVTFIQDYLNGLSYYDDNTLWKLSQYIEPRDPNNPPPKPPELMTSTERKSFKKQQANMDFELQKVDGYKFYEKDSPTNIRLELIDGIHVVSAATLLKLIERMTYDKALMDTRFLIAFLSGYREFCTSQELLDLLIVRYNVPPPKQTDAETKAKYDKMKLKPIRLRVFNAIKNWVEKHFYDFVADPELLAKLKTFIQNEIQPFDNIWATALNKAINKQQKVQDKSIYGTPPPVHEPPAGVTSNTAKITDFEPREVARQMCLIMEQDFRQIKPYELLARAWEDPQKAPNVATYNARFKQIECLFNSEIASCSRNNEALAKIISQFVKVATFLLEYNNFAGAKAIINGLERTHVKELTEAWRIVPLDDRKAFFSFKKHMDKNQASFREKMLAANPPSVPFLEIYLELLTEIENKHPKPNNSGMIEFKKYYEVAEYFTTLQNLQRVPYIFTDEPVIKNYLLIQRESASPMFGSSSPLPPRRMSSLNGNGVPPRVPAKPRASMSFSNMMNTAEQEKPKVPMVDKREVLEFIKSNAEFQTELRSMIREVIAEEFKTLRQKIKEARQENGARHPIPLKQTISREFPGARVDHWKTFDSKGTVCVDLFL